MHEAFVDYLQYSILISENRCKDEFMQEITPVRFYNRGYQDALGTRYFFGNPNTDKALVIMSGETLHNYRLVGWSDVSVVMDALVNGAKITRIDWAITDYVDLDLITPEAVMEEYIAGRIMGTLPGYGCNTISDVQIGQPPHLETVYLGDIKKRGKSGIFRAYDKGVDLGIWSEIITRLELEERKDNAHNSAKRFIAGATPGAIIRSRIEFGGTMFDRVLEDDPIDISRGENLIKQNDQEKQDNRWTWIFKQVAPAIREAIDKDIAAGRTDRINQLIMALGFDKLQNED